MNFSTRISGRRTDLNESAPCFSRRSRSSTVKLSRSDAAKDYAPAVGVRLPHNILERVDAWAAQKGARRSEALRDMVIYAVAGLAIDGDKTTRRKKK
jgi:hypothetical protein